MFREKSPFARALVVVLTVILAGCAGTSPKVTAAVSAGEIADLRVLPASVWAVRLDLAGDAAEDLELGARVGNHLDDAVIERLAEQLPEVRLVMDQVDTALAIKLRDYLYATYIADDEMAVPPPHSSGAGYVFTIYQRLEVADRGNRAAQLLVSTLLLAPSRPDCGQRSTMAVLMDLSTGKIAWQRRIDGGDPTTAGGATKIVENLLADWLND